jgi:hypothetical protein
LAEGFTELTDDLQRFIAEQHMFFVASAPLAGDGHVNLSPKGLDSFRVLTPKQVGYLDLPGSGVETIAHVRENGRIVIMFCAFSGRPRILRLHGRGRVVEPIDAEWPQLSAQFPTYSMPRSLILVDLERVADSCGFGVPRYEYKDDRTQLTDWAERKGAEVVNDYKAKNNATSLDGLPGLREFATSSEAT